METEESQTIFEGTHSESNTEASKIEQNQSILLSVSVSIVDFTAHQSSFSRLNHLGVEIDIYHLVTKPMSDYKLFYFAIPKIVIYE